MSSRRALTRWSAWIALVTAAFAVVGFLGSNVRSQAPVAYADARGHVLRHDGPPLNAYPWATVTDPDQLDPWGFPMRQCTSYVAWFLNAHGLPFGRVTRGPVGIGHFDDASTWDAGARAAGYPISSVPVVGSVAQWRAGEGSLAGCSYRAGDDGHVAVVVKVFPNGSVEVAEYNGTTRQFGVRVDRGAPRYLYIGSRAVPAVTH